MAEREIFTLPQLTKRRKELRNNMAKAEVLLWLELKGKKVDGHKFRRRHSITKFVVDFYCAETKLAIEIDGATHYTEEELENDKKRQNFIESLGIYFLRFANEEIYYDMVSVVDKIR